MEKMPLSKHHTIPALLVLAIIFWQTLGCMKEQSSEGGSSQPASQQLTLQLKAVANNQPLQWNTDYINPYNETYSVRQFRFYLQHISLVRPDGSIEEGLQSDSCFLVNFADTPSTIIKLRFIPGTYTGIRLTIGVDSALNNSGAQTGSLDPLNGMFWTWNTGYIMAKLEGHSPQATTPNQVFEYHIGGFEGSDKVMQQVTIDFPAGNRQLVANGSTRIDMQADCDSWFNGEHTLRIADTAVCTMPGSLARLISENYRHMFSIVNIQTN